MLFASDSSLHLSFHVFVTMANVMTRDEAVAFHNKFWDRNAIEVLEIPMNVIRMRLRATGMPIFRVRILPLSSQILSPKR